MYCIKGVEFHRRNVYLGRAIDLWSRPHDVNSHHQSRAIVQAGGSRTRHFDL